MVLHTGVTRSFVTTMSRTLGGDRVLQTSGWSIWPLNQTGIFTGVITQEATPCGQPRIPVQVFGTEIPCHQYGVTAAEAGRQVQVDHRPGRQEVDCQDFHWSAGQRDIYGSFLQAHQTMDGYSIVIYT